MYKDVCCEINENTKQVVTNQDSIGLSDIRIPDTLVREKAVCFVVLPKDKKRFLSFCKELGCKWNDEEEITAEMDEGKVTHFMMMYPERKIRAIKGSVSHMMCNAMIKLEFSMILEKAYDICRSND